MLKYPLEADGIDSDYVIFTPEEYKSNARGGGGIAPPSRGAGSIVLYMPNSTPAVGNGQNWNNSAEMFMGPRGSMFRDISGAAAAGLFSSGGSEGAAEAVEQSLKRSGGTQAMGDAVRQFSLEAVTGMLGTNANAALAVEKGVVFNPNIELLYSSPGLRGFTFQFTFVPKSPEENAAVNNIIRTFKAHSAPAKDGFMFKVPDVFQVTYMSGLGPNKNMNRFKKAALKGITVQANPQTAMHVAHAGGAPVETAMTLSFMEVDIITREDHEAVGGQGF